VILVTHHFALIVATMTTLPLYAKMLHIGIDSKDHLNYGSNRIQNLVLAATYQSRRMLAVTIYIVVIVGQIFVGYVSAY